MIGLVTQPAVTTPPSAAGGISMVAVGSMSANLAGYLLHVPASRWLGVSGYGGFASLLAAQLLLAVPALALQTVVAREVVRGASTRTLRSLGRRCATASTVLAAALVPVVAALLHVTALAAAAALAAAPVYVFLCGEQGVLQGHGHFRELAVVLGLAGIGKVVPAVAALAVGGGTAAAMAAMAAGTMIVAWYARRRADAAAGVDATAGAGEQTPTIGSVLLASQAQLVLVALSSMDLVLTRMLLDETEAGRYALGAVATKAAFWLPQAVGVVLYPRMAHPVHSAKAVRATLGALTAIGAFVVAAAAVAAPLAPLTVGAAYAPITGRLWLFALDGALLAVLQGALLAAIAGSRTRQATTAWVGLGLSMTAMVCFADSIDRLLGTAVITAAATTAVAAYLVTRTSPRGSD